MGYNDIKNYIHGLKSNVTYSVIQKVFSKLHLLAEQE